MAFEFTGRGLTLGCDFGNQSAEFRYRLDGGDWRQTARERYEWAGLRGGSGCSTSPMTCQTAYSFELRMVHANAPECKGTDMRLGLIGVFR